MSEEEITEQFLAEPAIEPSPADFTAAWPQALHIRVGRAALGGVLEALRDQNVRVAFNGLTTSCRVLRSGNYTVQIDVEADRVGAVFAKLKSMPGVTEAGFSSNVPEHAARGALPVRRLARWLAGKLDRDKLAAAVGAAMAKAMSATVSSTSWDATMGELVRRVETAGRNHRGAQAHPDHNDYDRGLAGIALRPINDRSCGSRASRSRIVDDRPAPRLTFALAAIR